jgi:hypothetical protein
VCIRSRLQHSARLVNTRGCVNRVVGFVLEEWWHVWVTTLGPESCWGAPDGASQLSRCTAQLMQCQVYSELLSWEHTLVGTSRPAQGVDGWCHVSDSSDTLCSGLPWVGSNFGSQHRLSLPCQSKTGAGGDKVRSRKGTRRMPQTGWNAMAEAECAWSKGCGHSKLECTHVCDSAPVVVQASAWWMVLGSWLQG